LSWTTKCCWIADTVCTETIEASYTFDARSMDHLRKNSRGWEV
jgi:hypothetical protein